MAKGEIAGIMLKLCVLVVLCALAHAESQVRETETWVRGAPQTDDVREGLSSGVSPDSSDFEFHDNNQDLFDEEDDEDDDDETDDDDVEDYSGSGDGHNINEDIIYPKSGVDSNRIPDLPAKPKSTDNEMGIVEMNEVGTPKVREEDDHPPNVLMAHASEESIFQRTEVLAALIAGCSVGLLFAILLILLLVYRMKKKDEGSYDLGKKPIYTKAPTAEIYA